MKKILSFILVCVLCLSLVTPAHAATYSTEAAGNQTGGAPTTWEFTRQYKKFYAINGGYGLVVQDPNYDIFDDRYVTVSLISSDGPTSLTVKVSWKKDSASTWEDSSTGTINLNGTACSFTIPENYTFKVEAAATAGKNGYATIQVVLT